MNNLNLKIDKKLLENCLKNYGDILKNYDDQSIKISKLEKIAQTLYPVRIPTTPTL